MCVNASGLKMFNVFLDHKSLVVISSVLFGPFKVTIHFFQVISKFSISHFKFLTFELIGLGLLFNTRHGNLDTGIVFKSSCVENVNIFFL